MQRASDLIGKPIISLDRGEKIGSVSDVLVDTAQARAIGLVIDGGMLHGERVLPYEDVQVLGRDVLIVRSGAGALEAQAWKQRGLTATRATKLRRRRVITRSGRELGSIGDLYLDDTGTVTGNDVERSGFAGVVRHRSRLLHTSDIAVGEDAVVVPEAAADAPVEAVEPEGVESHGESQQ
jgi:uncharacterized protein YrrD